MTRLSSASLAASPSFFSLLFTPSLPQNPQSTPPLSPTKTATARQIARQQRSPVFLFQIAETWTKNAVRLFKSYVLREKLGVEVGEEKEGRLAVEIWIEYVLQHQGLFHTAWATHCITVQLRERRVISFDGARQASPTHVYCLFVRNVYSCGFHGDFPPASFSGRRETGCRCRRFCLTKAKHKTITP